VSGTNPPAGSEVGSEAEESHTTAAEQAGEAAVAAEEQIETAAARGVLGGPYVWGLLALVVVILIILFLT
jgi:uncharacterized protein